ncbi:hypothetical protein [Catellatospora bangladeshensis]|uniref:Uncharacterized protein n=1 Tax=Catellatospora bangladeshensis TaxID=310355 RepID=A0A8J3JL97_9ACTN|nr:hypothetical protein [Catellatospora bangladeshensis]GIF82711.1 hypothetical protein Cba03nite_40600 [Catellatospora bangladeshensis]
MSRAGHPAAVEVAAQLDYYLVYANARARDRALPPEGIVLEEFVLRPDGTTSALDSAGWTAAGGTWWSAVAFSRGLRTDARLRARVTPADRAGAQTAYQTACGAKLPAEPELRRHFLDRLELPASAPSPLVPTQTTTERRIYRVLLAGELPEPGREALRSGWRMQPFDRVDDAAHRIAGRTRRTLDGQTVTWTLRQVGTEADWAVDLSTDRSDDSSTPTLAPLLNRLRTEARDQGLIPVTVDRLR